MTSPTRKKLIEVSIPLEAINVASAREKSIRHGHPSTLHLWWARRPLAACRAVLFAQLVDDPSAWPDRFRTEEAQDAERRRLHKVIERMVPWEASNDEAILNEARWEIARSVAWGLGEEPPPKADGKAIFDYLQTKAPPVYDPFSGGGSIPLEAQRLGLRAYGSDLNPVAVLIGKALVEIPPKFAGLPPVNPKAQAELKRGGKWNGKGAQGLAEDVRYYGQWMRDEAERRIGHLYPKINLPDGSEAPVIAWLWARTVRSPDPAAKGAMVPLVSSFLLAAKEGKKAWVEPVIDPSVRDGWRFDVKAGSLSKAQEDKLKLGTKAGKAQAFVCVLTGAAIDRNYIQSEGKADRLGRRLMAIVSEGKRSRLYLSPTQGHEDAASPADIFPLVDEARSTFLSPSTPTRAMITGGVCSAYGLRTYGHLFTPRQIAALTTLSDLVAEARDLVLGDAETVAEAGGNKKLRRDNDSGIAYADAVATYLAFAISRSADFWCEIATWSSQPKNELVVHAFGRQALPMTWDFGEIFPFSNSNGNFFDSVIYITKCIVRSAPAIGIGKIENINASENSFMNIPMIFSTDPPYYDNIGYAELSDFFYVWLRRSLSKYYPELFRRLAAPKENELVATRHQHGGKVEAEDFFLRGMSRALKGMRQAASENNPLAIYYAFKQSEATVDGVSSAGWGSFLQAIVDAGLTLDGTWPVRTERNFGLKGTLNTLASSIVLVCRARAPDALVTTRAEFIRALKREMPDAIDDIRKAGVSPVDMQQSVIGPGMDVFTRYAKVLESDDSAMSVKTALTLINRVWEEIENELDANFDPESQVALAWYDSYGYEAKKSGELNVIANAKNVPEKALFESGVFTNLHGNAALTPRAALPLVWSPSTDKHPTVWRCVQQVARALKAEEGGGDAAAKLVAQMGSRAADAQKLAYRLFEIATRKGLNDEALVYNELAQEWAKLEDIAASAVSTARTTGAQAAFQF